MKTYAISIGADAVYDDRSLKVAQEIAAAFPDLSLVFDIASTFDSNMVSVGALGAKGGHIAVYRPSEAPIPGKYKITSVGTFDIFQMSDCLRMSDPDIAKRNFVVDWLTEVEELLEKRKVELLVSQVREGGLEAMIQGIDDARNEGLYSDRLIVEM